VSKASVWTLNRLLVVLLLGGFIVTVLEVRYEHQEILKDHRIAWTPIVYSLVMVVGGAVSLAFWGRGGRQVLLAGFAAGLLVGATGVWLHSGGKPLEAIKPLLSAWTLPVGESSEDGGGPPALAPAAFIGLGAIGVLACAKRFQADRAHEGA
jgi:hypothetical protein